MVPSITLVLGSEVNAYRLLTLDSIAIGRLVICTPRLVVVRLLNKVVQ